MKRFLIPHIDGNATPRITEVLKQIVPGEKTLLQFEKGIYRCDCEGCTDKPVNLAYLTHDVKHIVFDLENAKDLTIDGNGAEFLFTERMFPFYLNNTEHVTLRDLTIDFSFSRYCQGTVIANDANGFELKIDRAVFRFSTDKQGHIRFACGTDSYGTDAVLLANAVFGRPPWHFLFAGDSNADKHLLPVGYLETDAVETAEGVRFNYRPGSLKLDLPLNDILLFNYEPRTNINILSRNSRDIRIDSVRIYRGGGMGIVADHTDNIMIENTRIEVRPGRPECRSTTADGMFFSQCKGQVTVRGCTIRNTLDDALNIHGFYTRIAAVEGPRTLRIEHAYDAHEGSLPFDAGDMLMVSDPETQDFRRMTKIQSYRTNPDGSYTVEMTDDVSDLHTGDLLENETRAADFLFENNEVCCVPHLRISDNGHMVIRNNRFEKIQKISSDDLLLFWYECGAVRDLTIENNLFTDVPWGHNGDYPVTIDSTRPKTSSVRHKNVIIRNNRFVNTDGRVAALSHTDGVRIENNDVEAADGIEAIRITDCTDTQKQ